jgi:hypothetical protein
MPHFKDRRFKDLSAVHLPPARGAAPTAGTTVRGQWSVGGASSRASAAPTTDAAAQHPQPAASAAPTAVTVGLHLPEDGSYPKTSTTPTAPRQITSVCSSPYSINVEFCCALGISTRYFYVWIMCELDLKTLAMSYVARATVCLLSYAVECLLAVCLCAAMIQSLNLH